MGKMPCVHANSIPTLSLQKRERQGWGNLSSESGKVGPAPNVMLERIEIHPQIRSLCP